MQDLRTFDAPPLEAPTAPRLQRWFFWALGSVLVGVGVLGILLPLLPTTVFLLGAAACFGKSSPGAYRWLMTNRFFGRYLREYKEDRGATPAAKSVSIVSLWGGMAFSVYLLQPPVLIDTLLAVIAVAVTWHLLLLRTPRSPGR